MSGSALHAEVADRPLARARPERTAAIGDGVLDGTVVLLATWTVVYHVSLLAGLGALAALALEAGLLAAVVSVRWVVRRSPAGGAPVGGAASSAGAAYAEASGEPTGSPVRRHRLALVTVVAAALCATAMAADLPWVLVWPTWLVAALTGTASAVGRLPGHPRPALAAVVTAREVWVVVGCTAALVVLSTVASRPNPDDLFYVNWSQWVAAHGEFPLRDTIYSDLGYPMANWPPMASYDGLVGAVAHLVGVRAGSVEYLLVPPLASAMAVWALWRLLRTWQVRHVTVAFLAAVVFLLVDGTSSYASPGNLFVTRLWQGKVILACVLVPLLLVHLLRHAERPDRVRLGWLAACGAAAVGLSTTAIFLVPVVAAAGVAPLVRTRPRSALAGFAAASAYPLAAGAVTLAVGGRSADDFTARRQFRFDPAWFGHEVFLTGALAAVAVLAVLVGALVVPHPAARVATGVTAVLVGVTLVPGVTHLSYDVVGLGPTLWRLTWGLAIGALVGAAASWVAGHTRTRRSAVAALVVAAVLAAGFGAPIWSEDTGTHLRAPFQWQRGEASMRAAAWMVDQAGPGERVLAPDGLAITVVTTQTDVKVVVARDYYLYYLRDDPTFHYPERLLLTRFANADPTVAGVDVAPALDLLDVGAVCLYRDDVSGAQRLRAAGYQQGFHSTIYRCFRR